MMRHQPLLLQRLFSARPKPDPTKTNFFQAHPIKSTERLFSARPKPDPTKTNFFQAHPIKSTVALSILSLAAYGVNFVQTQVGTLEGLGRAFTFYKVAIPSYLKYEYMQRYENSGSDEDEEKWRKMHLQESKKGLETILKLRGFYIKNGQMCASNIGNAFPKVWQDTMSVLQDHVPPRPFVTVKSVIEDPEHGLGKNLSEIFTSFDPEPIGSASIGQVHRAILKSGEKVVVKIMYPDVERVFRGDVRTCICFCRVAQPVHVPALEEIEKQFMTEFDYRREANQLKTVYDNLHKCGLAGKGGLCEVPKPHEQYCSKHVLVMEELEGVKLKDGLRRDLESFAKRQGKTLEQLKREEEEKLERSNLAGKDLDDVGPTAVEMSVYLGVLNSKRIVKNLLNLLRLRWDLWEGRDTLPLNHAQLVDQLIDIHGHEVLIDGYFNGDPHPGNLLLLENGKLGLIDYGQVKAISKENRVLLAKMIIALTENDKLEVIRLIREVGYKSTHSNPDLTYIYARLMLDADNKRLTEGLHIQKFMENLEKRDPIVSLPREFVMVCRVSLMLRGLGHALKQPRSIASAWRPIAERVLREAGEENYIKCRAT